jgi:large subunit ribosomal protein L9
MKVILNQDVKYLGEEGDIKTVATGYARNYLFPRNFAVPYNEHTAAYFESRKDEIEDRKAAKRTDATSIKARLEEAVVALTASAGPTGKLYGAVTAQTIVDELAKQGFEVERKRLEIPGLVIKHTGKYPVTVRLYEQMSATVNVVVEAEKEPERPAQVSPRRRSRDRDYGDDRSLKGDRAVDRELERDFARGFDRDRSAEQDRDFAREPDDEAPVPSVEEQSAAPVEAETAPEFPAETAE